jgi:hypothetical protein
MTNKAKLAFVGAVAAAIFASPVLAQTIDAEVGHEYGYQPATSDAAVHARAHAVRQNGLNAYAMGRRSAPGARMPVDSEDPASTGGGSAGYNELLQQEGN